MNATSSEERLTLRVPVPWWGRLDLLRQRSQRTRSSGSRDRAGFLLDVKSFSAFTNHRPSDGAAKDIREELPEKPARKRTSTWSRCPTSWSTNRGSVPHRPRAAAASTARGVFFQFPPWLLSRPRVARLHRAMQERMFGFQSGRVPKPEWMDARPRDGTWPSGHARHPFVAVDVPQGHSTSSRRSRVTQQPGRGAISRAATTRGTSRRARRTSASGRLQGPRPGRMGPAYQEWRSRQRVHAIMTTTTRILGQERQAAGEAFWRLAEVARRRGEEGGPPRCGEDSRRASPRPVVMSPPTAAPPSGQTSGRTIVSRRGARCPHDRLATQARDTSGPPHLSGREELGVVTPGRRRKPDAPVPDSSPPQRMGKADDRVLGSRVNSGVWRRPKPDDR